MPDFTIPNLAGANEEFNGYVSKLDIIKKNMLNGLEDDASSLATTLSTNLTSLTAELRNFVPELPSLPDINLQSQLSSLSKLSIGSNQYNTLLSSISGNFGPALSSIGTSLNTIVSEATSAITSGNSLSGIVPNMELPALGGEIKLLADAIKQATKDAEKETESVFKENDALKNLQSTINDAVIAAQKDIKSITKILLDGTKIITTISGGAHIVERIEA